MWRQRLQRRLAPASRSLLQLALSDERYRRSLRIQGQQRVVDVMLHVVGMLSNAVERLGQAEETHVGAQGVQVRNMLTSHCNLVFEPADVMLKRKDGRGKHGGEGD